MDLKIILSFLKIRRHFKKRYGVLKEVYDLSKMADIYTEYIFKKNNWEKYYAGFIKPEFFEISMAFTSGYIKALHDNGLCFQNGIVKKRSITEDMPIGGVGIYVAERVEKLKADVTKDLKELLIKKYGETEANATTIAHSFAEVIKGYKIDM